jgi:hypothetical protein
VSLFKRYIVRNKNVVYETDYGYIIQSLKTVKFTQFSYNEVIVDIRKGQTSKPGNFAELTLLMDEKIDEYHRSFTKLQNVFASIGGFFEGIIIVASLIADFFTSKLYYLTIINKTFTFVDVKKTPETAYRERSRA